MVVFHGTPHFGYRTYDVSEGNVQEEIRKPLPTEPQASWYGLESRRKWTDHTRDLLYDSKPVGEESIETKSEEKDAQVSGRTISATTVEESITVPPIIALEGPDVDPGTGSFAVLSQYLINKMDALERQFQKWYASLMLGLGKHLDKV